MSAKNILSPCTPSLFKALDPSNTYFQVWMDSYNEDKQGLIDHNGYKKTSKNQYLSLKKARKTPKAIPSMYVLVVKNDKDGKPLCAKSCIVILGNSEDRL